MREIKFRAWFTDGEYTTLPGQICSMQEDRTLQEFLNDVEDCKKEHGYNYILMQYTGLKDRNGKEIYEDDIFKAPHDYGPGGFKEQVGRVIFHETLGYQWNYWDFDKLEIIGNFHENPELLESN